MVWTLSRKVSAALAAILLSTMVLIAIFGYHKFHDLMSEQVRSRYSFVVFTIKKSVEDRLSLGLALRQLRQMQDIIEREKVGDANILGIEIYDERGEILFNTDRGAIGASVPPEWLSVLGGVATQPFSLVDEDNLVVGLPLVNTLGKVEGAVILRYPSAYLEAELGDLLGSLAMRWLVVLGVFAVIAVFGALAMFRSVGTKLAAMETALGKVLAEGGEVVPDPASGDPFEKRYAEFAAKSREAIDHIRDATAEVERLDRLG